MPRPIGAAIIGPLTYVTALAQLPHVIAGSGEVFYLIVTGEAGWRWLMARPPQIWSMAQS